MNLGGRQKLEWSSYTTCIQVFETMIGHYIKVVIFNPLLLKIFKVFKLVSLNYLFFCLEKDFWDCGKKLLFYIFFGFFDLDVNWN